eukprot:4368545-Pyramimonas_sp.AAC.1
MPLPFILILFDATPGWPTEVFTRFRGLRSPIIFVPVFEYKTEGGIPDKAGRSDLSVPDLSVPRTLVKERIK